MKSSALSLLLLSVVGAVSVEDLQRELQADPEGLAEKIRRSSLSSVLPDMKPSSRKSSSTRHEENSLPLVFLHGMGDSCFNRGMESITESSGEYLGVYSVCIPTGELQLLMIH